MAALTQPPKFQAFDGSGNPLANGKLYTYIAGTSTALATYTDAGGGTSNANPVILDSRGEANVWMSPTSLYKLVLKDSSDVTIWTVDNVGGGTNIADLQSTSSAALGDALIGFKQANSSGHLTGAVARTVHQKLQEFLSVLDFGATGDGTTNDASAIQAAVDAAGDGGVVWFPKPAAHYLTGTTSLKVRNKQQWVGASRADSGGSDNLGTTILYTGSGSAIYGIGKDSNTFTDNVRITGLRLIGDSAAQVLDMSGFIESRIEFINVDSSNASGVGILLGSTAGTGSGGGNCYYNTLEQVTLLNATGVGIKILQSGDSGTNDNRITGGKNTCFVGVKFEGSGSGALNSNNVIENMSFENNQASARAINCDTGVNNKFINNRYEYVGTSALDFLFGTTGERNLIIGGHFGSASAGPRITDNSTAGNFWFGAMVGTNRDVQLKTAQILFPSAQVASSDANTLDDYEEGAWTPTDASGAGLSLTVVANGCIYRKIGSLVMLFIDITYPATANGNTAQIGGLPFTSLNTTNAIGSGTPGVQNAATGLVCTVNSNATTMNFYVTGSARTNAQMSGVIVRGCICYVAAN